MGKVRFLRLRKKTDQRCERGVEQILLILETDWL